MIKRVVSILQVNFSSFFFLFILFQFVPETTTLCLSANRYSLCLKAAILADYVCGRISDTVCWRLGNPCETRRRTPHTANKSIVKLEAVNEKTRRIMGYATYAKCRFHIERIDGLWITAYLAYKTLLFTKPTVYHVILRKVNNFLKLLRENPIGYVKKIRDGVLVDVFV